MLGGIPYFLYSSEYKIPENPEDMLWETIAWQKIIENTNDKNEIEKIVLIKIPTEIYPNIFDTFVYLFAQAGIKNLSIEKKVDFQKLYNERNKS